MIRNMIQHSKLFREESYEGKQRTISFLNSVLKLQDTKMITKIRLLESSIETIAHRNIHFDILLECECENDPSNRNEPKRFIVKMQRSKYNKHENRWIYYAARSLTEEKSLVRSSSGKNFYAQLEQVKVITICDYDCNESYFGSDSDIIVNWGILNESSHLVATRLLSWTFIMLKRFERSLINIVSSSSEVPNFESDPLSAWLYLLTRKEEEEVLVTENLVAKQEPILGAYRRMSNLTEQESKILFDATNHEKEARDVSEFEKSEAMSKGVEIGEQNKNRKVIQLNEKKPSDKKRSWEEMAELLDVTVEYIKQIVHRIHSEESSQSKLPDESNVAAHSK